MKMRNSKLSFRSLFVHLDEIYYLQMESTTMRKVFSLLKISCMFIQSPVASFNASFKKSAV